MTRLSFRLGATAFGGPAAHIAILRDEAVTRRKWLSEQEFVDLLGATNLIPGPNSTEMVMHVGQVRAGRAGLWAAGAAFIAPAATITLVLAWFYVRYGTDPAGEWLLWGIKPVVIAIVAQAVWSLGRTTLQSAIAFTGAAVIAGLYLARVNEIVLLFGGAALIYMVRSAQNARGGRHPTLSIAPLPLLIGSAAAAAGSAIAYSNTRLFFTFLKIGALLYGSGYVLIAFMRTEFVEHLGWMTEQQLLDSVAAGQVTPGPVFSTATFAGYVMGGFSGAALATAAIFLPAFVFVWLTHPIIKAMRKSEKLGRLLDCVNIAAIGLMIGVLLDLTRSAVVDIASGAIAVIAFVLLLKFRLNPTWLIAFGAGAGMIRWAVG